MAAQPSKPKKLTDFLKEQEQPEYSLIQGYVPKDLRSKVIEQMKADKDSGHKVTWDSFFEAACKAYLAERKSV